MNSGFINDGMSNSGIGQNNPDGTGDPGFQNSDFDNSGLTKSTTPAPLSRLSRVRFISGIGTSGLGNVANGLSGFFNHLFSSDNSHMAPLHRRDLPFSDWSDTFGQTTDFWWGLAYDPAVVLVTCGDAVRDGRGVLLSAPLGRLAGLGL